MNTISGLIWVTGLSGAGKTTFAHLLQNNLTQMLQRYPVLLDGDALRALSQNKDEYSASSRHDFAHYYAGLSHLFVTQGHCVICSTISMFQDVRDLNRAQNTNYCEVFIDVDDNTRIARRDVGSVKKSEILSGASEYELPVNPDFTLVNPSHIEMEEMSKQITAFIQKEWTRL